MVWEKYTARQPQGALRFRSALQSHHARFIIVDSLSTLVNREGGHTSSRQHYADDFKMTVGFPERGPEQVFESKCGREFISAHVRQRHEAACKSCRRIRDNTNGAAAHAANGAAPEPATEPNPEPAAEIAPAQSTGSVTDVLESLHAVMDDAMVLAAKAEEAIKHAVAVVSYQAQAEALRRRYLAAIEVIQVAAQDAEALRTMGGEEAE